jgi:hypothetical protein
MASNELVENSKSGNPLTAKHAKPTYASLRWVKKAQSSQSNPLRTLCKIFAISAVNGFPYLDTLIFCIFDPLSGKDLET